MIYAITVPYCIIESMDKYPWLQTIFKLNPLYYIVYGYRDALFYKVAFWQRPELTVYFWAVTLILLGSGLHVFKKLKVHFADVL